MSPRFGIVIEQERCLGCDTCTIACQVENSPTTGPWIWVETVGSDGKDKPAGNYPDLRLDFLPRLCQHCAQPPCVPACPTRALWQRQDGLVLLADDKCNGCQVCLAACPYAALSYNAKTGFVEKCHLCHHRIDQGRAPFCVVCCEGQAMHFGDLDDPHSDVSQLIATRGAVTLKPEAGTKPAVYYCPPRPRRPL